MQHSAARHSTAVADRAGFGCTCVSVYSVLAADGVRERVPYACFYPTSPSAAAGRRSWLRVAGSAAAAGVPTPLSVAF